MWQQERKVNAMQSRGRRVLQYWRAEEKKMGEIRRAVKDDGRWRGAGLNAKTRMTEILTGTTKIL